MNACDILHNGHLTVLRAVEIRPDHAWEIPGVCGEWTAKEVLAHLASFEQLLLEVLRSFLVDGPMPMLDQFLRDVDQFNRQQVAHRRDRPVADILAEYEGHFAEAINLLGRIPPEMRCQNGTLPWYGDSYDLEDFLVYCYYGHKQEHCAQLAFRPPSSVFCI